MIRRIEPDADRDCFIEAHLWTVSSPTWFKQAERVFGPQTLNDFIAGSKEENRVTFGLFEGELIGVIIFTLRFRGVYEVDFLAKPRCDAEAIVRNCLALRDRLFNDLGAIELFCWLAQKNFPTRRLLCILGFSDSGLRLLRGTYRDRVIEWQRLSLPRKVWEGLKAA